MRTRLVKCFVLLIPAFFAVAALAQKFPAAPGASAAPKPPETKPEKKADSTTGIIPEVALDGIPLSDAIAFLRDVDPNFQAVISRGPGSESNGPIIQELKLKNVSTETVLQVLGQAYPELHIEPIAADSGQKIWMIRVDSGRDDPNGKEAAAAEAAEKSTTTVFRLREIIDGLCHDTGGTPEDRKNARDAVLSLLQTTIQMQETNGDVIMKLHEPTETLVFKGTARKSEMIAQALSTLEVPPNEAVDRAKAEVEKTKAMYGRLQTELGAMKDELNRLKANAAPAHPLTTPEGTTPAKHEPEQPKSGK